MTSRERLLAVANHREPDRIPVDLGSTRSSGISAIAYRELTACSGQPEIPLVYDIQQQICWPSPEFIRRHRIDLIDAGRAFLGEPDAWRDMTLLDGSPARIPAYHRFEIDGNGEGRLYNRRGTMVGIKPATSHYVNQAHWPWRDLNDIPAVINPDDFEDQIWAVPSSPYHLDIMNSADDRRTFAAGLKEFYRKSDQAVVLDFGVAGFFETPGYLRGLENWFCDLLSDPAGRDRFLDAYQEYCLRRLDVILTAAGDSIDVLRLFWDDMGSQTNVMFEPELFKTVFAPRYRKLIEFIHSKSACKVLVHSCGSIYQIIPHLIDAGVQLLNPVQTATANMEPKRLKREFGRELVFWGGGIDTVEELTTGTPDQIRESVRRRMGIFGEDGIFVFAPTHNIQAGVPAANIAAMLEAIQECTGATH